MKSILGSVGSILLGAVILSAATGCKVACKENEQDSGGQCVAKSLTRFDGTPASKSAAYAAGNGLSVDGVYGNVTVKSGAAAGNVEVTFQPFDYEGYDEKDLATRQINEDLVMDAAPGADVTVTTSRHDSSNGLGANIMVLLPPEFDGTININNRGNGPIATGPKEFDNYVDFVGASTTVNIKGGADLGDCTLNGSSNVTSTTVDCGHLVDVRGVSDNVNLTSREGEKFDDPTIILALASISADSTGGDVLARTDGPIDATFPSTGTFAIQAYAPNNGTVDTGNVPSTCTIQEASPPSVGSKTVNCGLSPIYKLTTNGETDSVFANGNIYLHFQ